MKICYVTTIPKTLGFIMKSSKYIHEKENIEIFMISSYQEEFYKSVPNYVTYIPISMKRGIDFSALKSIINMYKIFKKEKFDLIQYCTPNASLYASIAAKMAGIKVRLYCQWGIRYVGFSGIKRKIFKLIEKIICYNSTWIEPDSYGNFEFSQSEKLYKTNKASVIWNGSASGVDLEKFNLKNKSIWRNEIRSKYKILNDEILIGFVGRIDKDKGINELIEAFKLSCEENLKTKLKLLIVGEFNNENNINKELIKWATNSKNVIFSGEIENVEKYYSAMDIFAFPSYREGFGSVVIEAEAMGVPVIVTNIPGPIDAMIENETGLIIEKANVLELKDAINNLVNDYELREKMSKKGVDFVKEKFDDKKLFKYILEDKIKLIKDSKL